MTYVLKDGKIYRQYEEEVDLAKEEYTLQAWKDAIQNDQREMNAYMARIDEIENLKAPKETREYLKNTIPFYSGSGITQSRVDDQQAKVDEIKSLLNGNII